jgi:protein-S-isoprenylcysteine O-methyltransferase Ste14
MFTDAAHTRWWQTFEAVVGIPFLLGIALHRMLPISFGDGLFTLVRVLAGSVLVGVGILVIVATRRAFRSYQQPTDPGRPTGKLITTGVFAHSRNPLYLGGVCVLVGLALALNLVWGLLLLAPALVACHVLLIVPEERYLAAKFGEDYRSYAATVRRWIGRSQKRS